MFRQTGLTVYFMVVACVFAGPMWASEKSPVTTEGDSIVWFDSTGAYHYGGLLEYINEVLADTSKDPDFSEILKKTVPGKKTVTVGDLPRIAAAFDPLKHTAAVYIQGAEYLEKHKTLVKDAFKDPAAAPGLLTLKAFGIQGQGNIAMVPGSTQTNLLLAIPADPLILAGAGNTPLNNAPQMEAVFIKASQTPDWQPHARRSQVMSTGVSTLFNLHPGPWIVYMNQYSVIVQCYRVLIQPGSNELTADQICFRPRLGSKTETKGDDASKQ